MNRLAAETSPYLRQHAANPVDWFPWGEEALDAARRRDRPLLVSVGYSACHWCHVMAHESFEDPATAAVMNELCVNVKVDREERPDVDSVYMEATQAVNGSGGWPMTVLCLPDGRPFFAGTYFPRDRFVALLQHVDEAWRERRADLEGDAQRLAEAVRAGVALPGAPGAGWAADGTTEPAPAPDLVATTAARLLGSFDPEWGGFGRAPKFPQPAMVELVLRAARVEEVTTTLDAMASGGIYDHLGGGFARYATDRRWLVPHFEKMLYDNALLVRLYTHAWQATGNERWRQVVSETVDYLLSPPMRQAGGGLSSAEDADSEGVEGRYYTWDRAEVVAVAGPAVARWYGVTEEGNWEGKNILWRPERGALARPDEVERGRRALLDARQRRVRPGLDDKVLTEWNAMAVAALAEAGAGFRQPAWLDAATEVAEFLVANLRRADGRWLRSWQARAAESGATAGGGARVLAYAADHAWLIEAFTRLAEATGRRRWIAEAREAADALLGLFADQEHGGFFTSGADAEALIARPKDTYDGAIPSANSVAAAALARLGALTGEARYTEHAKEVVAAMAPALDKAPTAFTGMVAAADLLSAGVVEVVVTGERPDLVDVVAGGYRPRTVLAWGEPYESPLWEGRDGPDQADRAFVCRNYACEAPVTAAGELSASLAR